ncbi:MAG: flagellar biosynthetic protein FliO [Butyrivibrio sp.]|nr:flagellar biosynthetic protein FliO [Acetatifactor muris]MCM1558133.1 flagellar biosynthetic protein FliO [Butyrivibrio sp.]
MTILLTGRTDSYAQLITVLVVFVLVLGVTALVTRWMANYQKQQNVNVNVEIIETTRISNNKYIQIVRLGATYVAIAVCKDTVTQLCEIPEEQLKKGKAGQGGILRSASFKELLDRAAGKNRTDSVEAEDNQSDDSE